ncbi:cytochrome c oxidase subunit 7A2, mitochondrial [Pimephales promelas]|nr:cytochrome c oxidase subunit 7A2, mitochondrial [Pimephales promelas]
MRHLLTLPRLASRAFSTTVRQMKNQVPESQKVFLEDNGLPIHIKGGTTDVLLYRLTMAITVAACPGEPVNQSAVSHIQFVRRQQNEETTDL